MRPDLFRWLKRPYLWLRRLSVLAVLSASEGVGVVFFSWVTSRIYAVPPNPIVVQGLERIPNGRNRMGIPAGPREGRALRTPNRVARRHCRVSDPWWATSSLRANLSFRKRQRPFRSQCASKSSDRLCRCDQCGGNGSVWAALGSWG
jgi:hypothetical protein